MIFEIIELHSCLLKNQEKQKNILKSKKICKIACQNENGSKLIKIRIFGDPKP